MDIIRSESTAEDANSRHAGLFILAAIFAALGLAAFAVDMPLARYFHYLQVEDKFPGDIKKLFNMFEVFGHGVGRVHYSTNRFRVRPRSAAFADAFGYRRVRSGAGGRLRENDDSPHSSPFFRSRRRRSMGYFRRLFTFWAPEAVRCRASPRPTRPRPWDWPWDWRGYIHAAVGCLPRSRCWVACQRMQSGAHFLSDTLFGAALGCVVAAVCLNVKR